MSRSLSREGEFQFDERLSTLNGDILLEVRRTSGSVDLRGVLLSLAYALQTEPRTTSAVCVLADTRLAKDRLLDEVQLFHRVVEPEISRRVSLLGMKDGRLYGPMPPGGIEVQDAILEAAQREMDRSPGRVSQQTVKAAVLNRWFTTRGLVGVSEMSRDTGASMPTAIAAFKSLHRDNLVYQLGSRWHLADELPWTAVRRIVEAHSTERGVVRYADPAGHAKPPDEMAERLRKLQSEGRHLNVQLGGVIGAEQYDPDIDITAAPRLDLCVYDDDVAFVRRLDAGLVKTTDPSAKAVLVVHLTRGLRAEPQLPGELRAASIVDCLADLLEIGLLSQAKDFWRAMEIRRRNIVEGRESDE